MGVNPTQALVMSQVVLSIALPVPMIALIIFTSRRDVMGSYAMRPATKWLAFVGATIVLALNFTLLASVFGIRVPFMAI
jgi:manganese transport protein